MLLQKSVLTPAAAQEIFDQIQHELDKEDVRNIAEDMLSEKELKLLDDQAVETISKIFRTKHDMTLADWDQISYHIYDYIRKMSQKDDKKKESYEQLKIGDTVYYAYKDFDGKGIIKGTVTEVHDEYSIMTDTDGITYWLDKDTLGNNNGIFSSQQEAEVFLGSLPCVSIIK